MGRGLVRIADGLEVEDADADDPPTCKGCAKKGE